MEPKVTVVVPSFNVAQYIGKCLDSVLGQTLKDIEVIVVDAFSTDGTREIIEEYMKKDTRVTLVDDIKKSTGYSKNVAIDMAKGEYYAIVESDDYIELDMLEKLYQVAERTGVDFVKSNFSSFIGEGENRYDFPKTVALNSNDYEKILNPREYMGCFKWVMFEWLGLYRVDFLRKYNIRHNETPGAAFQDTGFWFLTFAYATKVYLMKDSFYHYRSDNPYASVKDPKKTMNVCVEYEYILKEISEGQIDFEKLRTPYCRGFFYDNCMALKRIDEDLKPQVIHRMRQVLTEYYDKSVNRSIFYEDELKKLDMLLRSEEEYLSVEKAEDEERIRREKELISAITGRDYIYIYGAGSYGANLHYFLSTRGYDIKGYIDSDVRKHGQKLNGKVIFSLEESKSGVANPLYLVANREHSGEIYDYLIENGIEPSKIYICDIDKCVRLLI
ncbi:Glycosyltransferase involved in cell wall bisynthesis [Pseudobutyrivibrio sp. YE44]|uniref:glycosyltransferase n=1 Tax=Pseudobutyrivibrio sp. YE44 TaxID=1520802 RepID=UPI00088C5864|nr:glycosyltransferase [Pseudobutyrivibrio sp. YE44]SDB29070.1 Glycosyltransferase involved in cell wall bisynthesis [Pseudobutyrivibrio sp. YE44]